MVASKKVFVPSVKEPIARSPGFEKKALSHYKLDILALCAFACAFCSSNFGNYLRMRRKAFADLTEAQTGLRTLPAEDPELTFLWKDVLEKLEKQLARKPKSWGAGLTLVYSMLTDAFSPPLVKDGTTEAALRQVLEKTSFRIRILTKNSIVGMPYWIDFFQQFPGRFVVGLSIGSLDDAWARRVERYTSPPTSRVRALRRLQDAGVPTYGMLCPAFREVLEGDHLERLLDAIRPERCEDLWAEPYNDRQNWRQVQAAYEPGTPGYEWFTEVFGKHRKDLWSAYATELYKRLRDKAQREGCIDKLHFLLYETGIVAKDAPVFAGLEGVMLQSKPNAEGLSMNPYIAALQSESQKPK